MEIVKSMNLKLIDTIPVLVFFLNSNTMGCFNTLFILLIGGIYFFWPDLMQVEGFWFTMIAVWVVFFISFALFGDIADEIAGVNREKDQL